MLHGPIKYNYLACRLACCPSTMRPCTMAQFRPIIELSSVPSPCRLLERPVMDSRVCDVKILTKIVVYRYWHIGLLLWPNVLPAVAHNTFSDLPCIVPRTRMKLASGLLWHFGIGHKTLSWFIPDKHCHITFLLLNNHHTFIIYDFVILHWLNDYACVYWRFNFLFFYSLCCCLVVK